MKTKPIGISQWKLLGKKYGYYKYFEDEVRQSERKRVIKKLQKLPLFIPPIDFKTFASHKIEIVTTARQTAQFVRKDLIKRLRQELKSLSKEQGSK